MPSTTMMAGIHAVLLEFDCDHERMARAKRSGIIVDAAGLEPGIPVELS